MLKNKKALILGVASKRSIAHTIAENFYKNGAEIAISYQSESLKERIEEFSKGWGNCLSYQCDVTNESDITNMFNNIGDKWNNIDIIVHSIAYAPSDQLKGNYIDVINLEGFRIAHEVSSYSLASISKNAKNYLNKDGASIISLSYLGAERVVPNYNVMGVAKASLEANIKYLASGLGLQKTRVNGISAGPIKTLAASGIKNFKKILNFDEENNMLKRNITLEDVANTATFLASDMSLGITGEIIHVDAGFNQIAIPSTVI